VFKSYSPNPQTLAHFTGLTLNQAAHSRRSISRESTHVDLALPVDPAGAHNTHRPARLPWTPHRLTVRAVQITAGPQLSAVASTNSAHPGGAGTTGPAEVVGLVQAHSPAAAGQLWQGHNRPAHGSGTPPSDNNDRRAAPLPHTAGNRRFSSRLMNLSSHLALTPPLDCCNGSVLLIAALPPRLTEQPPPASVDGCNAEPSDTNGTEAAGMLKLTPT
jgi:hypothetical protein